MKANLPITPRIIFLALGFFFLVAFKGYGQQKTVYSQYMFNGLVLNPAYAGNQKQFSSSFMHRDQWINVEGAPEVQTVTAHSALEDYPIGIGGLISKDRIGVHNNYSLYLSYAYQINMPSGQLALGLQAGFDYLHSNFKQLNLKDPQDQILSAELSSFNPNFGTGAFFSNETTYIGFSIPFLIHNQIYKLEEIASNAKKARYYFLTGGHVMTLSETFKFKPSGLIRVQEGQPMGFDLNGNLFIDDVVNVGVSYRSGDAMIGLFEIILNENFSFGYAYDYTLSDITQYTAGTHEFMLNYRFPIGENTCHTYF